MISVNRVTIKEIAVTFQKIFYKKFWRKL